MVVLALAISACLLAVPSQATSTSQRYALPVESYAPYQPQRTCARTDKPGTVALGRWLVARGGVYGGTLRSCGSGGRSERKDGRAFDWMLDAKDADDRAVADAFLVEAFADNELGDADALARRMGIMYVIWNDRMYAALARYACSISPRNSPANSARSASLRHPSASPVRVAPSPPSRTGPR